MRSIGIFAGVGGIELGFRLAGIDTELLCELNPVARSLLKRHFPKARLAEDVRDLKTIPKADVLTAGFPCQDLSQAGQTRGLNGSSSGLVSELFRLLRPIRTRPRWIVLENVPFMLQLHGGRAMTVITRALERYGYVWAYRVIDSRSFGVPQRRRRVFLVASNDSDPRSVLFRDSYFRQEPKSGTSHGFYWTEGNTGIGWAVDAVPALKAGSKISIPSPPAVWIPDSGEILTPDIRDAERLQGLPVNWTRTRGKESKHDRRVRWGLVGNAVTAPVAEWIAEGIANGGGRYRWAWEKPMSRGSWPFFGWGCSGKRFEVYASEFPTDGQYTPLSTFLQFAGTPLSFKATAGVLGRLLESSLKVRKTFIRALQRHVRRMERIDRVNEAA